ncbi:MAG: U32 family peptidase [Ruminococcus sp.]|nr:U32 family peptidase [Ruminococcus sp.]
MKRPEILAPAGSIETLRAALRSGAGAVYAGGKRFSARSSASNFTNDELAEAVKLCHLYGAKFDLAVNTVISDSEAEDFCKYIKYAASVGVDAFIVQDWGCAELIRRCVPDAVLHASTQMSVHTAAGAEMLGALGYQRVVPARELGRDTIAEICRKDIEVEIFVHGALCMSVSGQCYMSAFMGSRSANRGCCGQACRLPFSAAGNKDRASLSLKDLSLLPRAEEISALGIDSLKIEGRMKRPEYVASAVHELSEALDGAAPDMALLRGIFSRGGFTDGYFTGKRQDMFGVREKEDVTAARTLIPQIHELYRYERPVHTVDFRAVLRPDEPLTVTAHCGDISVTVTGDVPAQAQNRPTDCEAVCKQLSKLGDTVFRADRISADISGDLFVPAGKLNELRRELTDRLAGLVIKRNTPEYTITDYVPELAAASRREAPAVLPVRAFCRTAEQASAAAPVCEYTAVPLDIADKVLAAGVPAEHILIIPPRFIADEKKLTAALERAAASGMNRLVCCTPDHIALGKKLGFRLHGFFTLNVYNSFSAERLRDIGLEDCIVSVEATLPQIAAMRTELPLGAVTYGRVPLMLTRNCPIKNEVGCKNCTGSLTDRTGRRFPVACSGEYVEILNPDCLLMSDRLGEFRNISFSVLLLSDEDAAQTLSAAAGRKTTGNITRGLYYRGI